jgi:hypothetical protein
LNCRAGASINQLDFLSSFLALLTGAGAPQKKPWIQVQVSLTNSLSFSLFSQLEKLEFIAVTTDINQMPSTSDQYIYHIPCSRC